ncbi:hypothetical protein [Paenibacillus sp. NAIST15-1]|uniref:hypothetical protein n=1 Tax=Paenibacillus sp. NAIST15-1 TaxID=1605994 RepID=UPI00086F3344|nr:hypothetical protein [Paenibacillus sp. NAIST15-1]GAV12951.1 hypothetical protein PBN151_2884 [Paenibacillus sp. NAIST15-1]
MIHKQKERIITDTHPNNYEQIFNEIEKLPLLLNDVDYYPLVKRGYDFLVMLHDSGLDESMVYNRLLAIHQNLKNEWQQDFIAELLDFVCGFIGNQAYYIWRHDGAFSRELSSVNVKTERSNQD